MTYPDGAWLGYWYDDGAVITVATPTDGSAQRLVDSVSASPASTPTVALRPWARLRRRRSPSRTRRSRSAATAPTTCSTASRLLIGTESQAAKDATSLPVRHGRLRLPDRGRPVAHGPALQRWLRRDRRDRRVLRGLNGLFMCGVVRDLTAKAIGTSTCRSSRSPPESQ